MRSERPRNMSASVRDRLLQISKARREDFQLVLTRYAAERFLYRVSQSAYRQKFILKGATLFAHWTGELHRPTRDLDFLGYGDPQIASVVEIFTAVCQETVEEDGMAFLSETITGAAIRDDEEYEGVRITVDSLLGKARIQLQIDIGFGDAVTPAPLEAELPTLLNLPAARLLTYPRETVVAEKCEAMVHLGLRNSRLKDFYDLWYLATHFDFDGRLLLRAVAATFDRRGRRLPVQIPPALTPAYYGDPAHQAQWQAFLRNSNLSIDTALSLEGVVSVLLAFLMPLLNAASADSSFDQLWRHEVMSWSPIL